MFFSKKADGGLSMGFVVILAISLVVMIVIIGIFTSRAREGGTAIQGCEARGGKCVSGGCQNDPEVTAMQITGTCPGSQVCCLRRFDEDDGNAGTAAAENTETSPGGENG